MAVSLRQPVGAPGRKRVTLDPLELSLAVLPHLRGGLTPTSADWTARLLVEYLGLDAAAVVDHEVTLGFAGPVRTITALACHRARPTPDASWRPVSRPLPAGAASAVLSRIAS